MPHMSCRGPLAQVLEPHTEGNGAEKGAKGALHSATVKLRYYRRFATRKSWFVYPHSLS